LEQYRTLLSECQSLLNRIRIHIPAIDREYSLFAELIKRISNYIEDLESLLCSKHFNKFLWQTKGIFFDSAWGFYLSETWAGGEKLRHPSDLRNLLASLRSEIENIEDDKRRIEMNVFAERDYVLEKLPLVLAIERPSTKERRRDPQAEGKKVRLLEFLGFYQKWQSNETKESGRKRLGPRDWLEEKLAWPKKANDLFEMLSDSSLPEEEEIKRIIDYAHKLNRPKASKGNTEDSKKNPLK
jgi:hypothetical protein